MTETPDIRHIGRHGSALTAAIGIATILTGLIAGFFYAYACSVMLGLDRVDDRTFIHTMQEINATVRNAWFAPSFFGSLILPVVLAGWAWLSGRRRLAGHLAVAAICYGIAFAITMGISVPLNDELAAAGAIDTIADLRQVRDDYEDRWVLWNIVRTVAAIAALAVMIRSVAIAHRNPESAVAA